eukprot:scaffold20707_cov78-Skeletonema_dohrnii-CCMP3373.AAC.1
MAKEVGEAGGIGVSAASGKGKAGGIDIDIDIDISSCCASCGIAEVDDIKLTTCDANCKLVRYCSVACQRDHRPSHEAMCKKRLAEMRNVLLFAQPESSHLGDCPICFLPLPLDASKRAIMTCCSKLICNGCSYANKEREQNPSLEQTCPFCRHPLPTTKAEVDANEMRRVEANDPVALRNVGIQRCKRGEFMRAFEFLTKAAGLGDARAHYQLSLMYLKGKGVEKDAQKEVYHLEEAAIAGHPTARFNLGSIEWNDGRVERAVKHWIIAAKLGEANSMEILKKGYLEGVLSKEDFAAALRAHQAAVDAMKSPQREAAHAELTLFAKPW